MDCCSGHLFFNQGICFLGFLGFSLSLGNWVLISFHVFVLLVNDFQDVFESHKVVFTVGTSVASVATAWIGEFLQQFLFVCLLILNSGLCFSADMFLL